MIPDSFRVRAPSSIVFLCGGVIDPSADPPKALRDAFHRITKAVPPPYTIVLAEEAKPLTTDAGYGDLLSFESDIAQVVGLILLFVESPGSLAELGAFAALTTVAPSLLAVLHDFHYEQGSFIKNGPVKYLENKYGEECVLQLEHFDLGITDAGIIDKLNLTKFNVSVTPAIERRLASRNVTEKFDQANAGHAILLMTGLCQEFGALRITEIRDYLSRFGVTDTSAVRLKNYIYCAELLGWIKFVRKGNYNYYVSTGGEFPLDYNLAASAPFKEKVRWRSDIRHFWHKEEPTRIRAIADVTAAAAAAKP